MGGREIWMCKSRSVRGTGKQSIARNSTNRTLNPDEFRGFVSSDPIVPLVFVNGADSKAAQMFTLVHELAHIWIGEDALVNLPVLQPGPVDIEKFCNRVAAEFLVPEAKLRAICTMPAIKKYSIRYW